MGNKYGTWGKCTKKERHDSPATSKGFCSAQMNELILQDCPGLAPTHPCVWHSGGCPDYPGGSPSQWLTGRCHISSAVQRYSAAAGRGNAGLNCAWQSTRCAAQLSSIHTDAVQLGPVTDTDNLGGMGEALHTPWSTASTLGRQHPGLLWDAALLNLSETSGCDLLLIVSYMARWQPSFEQ